MTTAHPASIPFCGLNIDHPSGAYHCGRLLAVLQQLQALADRKANTTYVDRYYSAASSRPASVIPRVFSTARHRLKQIKSRSIRVDMDLLLTQTHQCIDRFPVTLSVQQQGDFQLGFFHQRASLPQPDPHYRRRIPTFKGEAVMSSGEQFIANTLYLVGISYSYEKPLSPPPSKSNPIHPDFTIELGSGIHWLYIEYTGLCGESRYDRMMDYKRSFYRAINAKTIEEVRVDGQLTQHTLMLIEPSDIYIPDKGREMLLSAIKEIEGQACADAMG